MSTNKLDQYIPSVTDLSDWTINLYANTGGSRAKRIASEPVTDDLYFVKGSKVTKDGEIKYPTEFL